MDLTLLLLLGMADKGVHIVRGRKACLPWSSDCVAGDEEDRPRAGTSI